MTRIEDDPAVRARGTAARIPQIIRAHVLGIWNHATLSVLGGSALIPTQMRWLVLRAFGLRVSNCGIAAGVRIMGSDLMVGRYTFIHMECLFDTSAPIAIGSECAIGPRCSFITSTHDIGPGRRRAGARRSAPITVGDGVWIAAAVTVLPGVSIGSGVVIAAGSVVTHDCVPDTLYAGVPARPVRELHGASN